MRKESIPCRTLPGRGSVEYERRPKPWAGEARMDPCTSVVRGAAIGYLRYFDAVSKVESGRGTIAARQAAAAARRMDAISMTRFCTRTTWWRGIGRAEEEASRMLATDGQPIFLDFEEIFYVGAWRDYDKSAQGHT
jgi:hypothetical protein